MMRRLVRLLVTAGLGVAYIALLAAALLPLPLLFLAAAAAVVVTELVLSRRAPYLLPEVLNAQLGTRFRLLSLDVLTAVLAARLLPDAGGIVALALVAVVLLAAGRDIAAVFTRRVRWRQAGGPVSWRNLHVAGVPHPRALAPTVEPDAFFALLTLLIPLGYAIGAVTDRFGAAIAAQWIVIAVVVVLLAGRLLQYVLLNGTSQDAVREAVRQAVEQAGPEVVLHHSGRRGTVEQVLLWLPALAALQRPCLIVVREQSHLDALEACGFPVVWAPRSQDVEQFMVASVELALYPSDQTNVNNHLLRVPGIYDVLIGHGDSDEQENRSPIARMYDEVWVAGAAGRARYGYPESGLPAAKIREIGPVRPPRPTSAAASRRPTVVYAPSWENSSDPVDVSSLVPRGEAVLDALLARQDVRVVFAPAPPTGSRSPVAANTLELLTRRVRLAGRDHAVIGRDRLPEELAGAAMAIVDVSPELAEAVRADVPVAVPAIARLDAAGMRGAFESTGAGTILTSYPRDVFRALDDALGGDSTAAARLAYGRRLDLGGDVLIRFRMAADEAIALQRRRRAFARPTL